MKGFGVEELTPENILLEFIGSQNYVDADPAKNSKAETERIGNNITSTTRILAQKGVQIDQIYLEKAQEYLKAEEYAAEWGVPLEVLYSSTQGKANAEIEVEEEVDQDDSITEETINNKFKGLEL